jgi:hypothetical protein
MSGTLTAMVDPHKSLVTGGILRSSAKKSSMVDLARTFYRSNCVEGEKQAWHK